MKSAAGLLFKSEQKRRKLRRLVREISRFFSRPNSLMPEGGKSGPFLSHKGLTMLPNGEISRTRDGGRDVICLTRKDGLDLKLIIECKRYAAHRKISVNQIRALYGVKQNENVTKAILATTSSFTPDAVDFAKPHIWELQLLDYDAILRLISGYAAGKRSIGRS